MCSGAHPIVAISGFLLGALTFPLFSATIGVIAGLFALAMCELFSEIAVGFTEIGSWFNSKNETKSSSVSNKI